MVFLGVIKIIEIKLLPTHVWRNCEFCGKFTFAFRKKFYLSGK